VSFSISQTRGPLSRTLWLSAQLAESMSTRQRARIARRSRHRASRRFNSHRPRFSWRGCTLTSTKEEYEIHPFDRSALWSARHGFGHVR
jgi:hypothetical protein